jgi:hypothetical protein
MTNKTISINPSLFSISGGTKKKREKINKPPSATPLISPNILKNKLLKRIKEHKKKETSNLEHKKSNIEISSNIKNDLNNADNFNDEFNDSINYLQSLTKQKKLDEDKLNLEKQKQKRRAEMEKMTVRNYHSLNQPTTSLVNLELPEELQQPLIHINTEKLQPVIQEPISLSFVQKDNVPYGILKGGVKPTYRTWSQTQKNVGSLNQYQIPNSSLIIDGEINKSNNERENRLHNLREKIKLNQVMNQQTQTLNSIKDVTHNKIENTTSQTNENNVPNVTNPNNVNNSQTEAGGGGPKKQIIKRTIKRKYTLGKSKIKKTVSVLLKDRGTRKRIISAQKELKQKSINDIKSYLRDHNMIKIGSNAPNDVIRKLYESCMLAGEVTNSNTDILLHNLIKDTKEI